MEVMVDLETWGVTDKAVIRAISLVSFDTDGHIYKNVLIDARDSIDDQLELGRIVDGSTVRWWRKQETPLSKLMLYPHAQTLFVGSVEDILERIREFFAPLQAAHDRISVWSRGSFDLNILRNLFQNSDDKNPPWAYWEERDVRTLDSFIKKTRSNNPHHPTADAEAQVAQVVAAFSALGRKASRTAA